MCTAVPLDAESLQADFPVLDQWIGPHRLVYLDSAATAQKPWAGRSSRRSP